MHEMFCLLNGHKQNFCNLNFDDFTIPIFEAKPGSESSVPLDNGRHYGAQCLSAAAANSFRKAVLRLVV